MPDGLGLVHLPRDSPQLQPGESLWPVLEQPIANKYFETIEPLDAVVAERCRTLETSPVLFQRAHRLPPVAQNPQAERIGRIRYETNFGFGSPPDDPRRYPERPYLGVQPTKIQISGFSNEP